MLILLSSTATEFCEPEGKIDLVICFLTLQGEGIQNLNARYAKETQNIVE